MIHFAVAKLAFFMWLLKICGVGASPHLLSRQRRDPIPRHGSTTFGRDSGRHPLQENLAIFNGLGSKGVLYAPGAAERLASHLSEGTEIEEDLDVRALAV